MTQIQEHALRILTRKAIEDGRLTRAHIVENAGVWAKVQLGKARVSQREWFLVAQAPPGQELRRDFRTLKNSHLEHVQVGFSGFLLYVLHTEGWQHRFLVPLRTEQQRRFASQAAVVRPRVAFVLPDGSGAVVHRCEHLFDASKLELAPEVSNRAKHAHITEYHQALSLALNPGYVEVGELAKNAPMSVSFAAPVEDFRALLWGEGKREL